MFPYIIACLVMFVKKLAFQRKSHLSQSCRVVWETSTNEWATEPRDQPVVKKLRSSQVLTAHMFCLGLGICLCVSPPAALKYPDSPKSLIGASSQGLLCSAVLLCLYLLPTPARFSAVPT